MSSQTFQNTRGSCKFWNWVNNFVKTVLSFHTQWRVSYSSKSVKLNVRWSNVGPTTVMSGFETLWNFWCFSQCYKLWKKNLKMRWKINHVIYTHRLSVILMTICNKKKQWNLKKSGEKLCFFHLFNPIFIWKQLSIKLSVHLL